MASRRSRAPQTSGPYALCHPFSPTSDAPTHTHTDFLWFTTYRIPNIPSIVKSFPTDSLEPSVIHTHTHTHTHTWPIETSTPFPLLMDSHISNKPPAPLFQTHTHTHVCFCEKWGHPIGIMVFILYKLNVLLPYTNPTPKLSPHRRLCISTFSKKTHSVWFISVLKSGDMGQCPHKSPSPCNTCHTCVIIHIYVLICYKNAHTRTHTHTHLHVFLTHRHFHLFSDAFQGQITQNVGFLFIFWCVVCACVFDDWNTALIESLISIK